MIETTLINYINNNLSGIEAFMEVPENPADSFVIIEKTGSSTTDRVTTSTIAVQSYGATLFDSAELNEKIKTIMSQITELDEVGACYLNSDYNFTDTTTKRYRYQAVFDITHY